MAAVLSFLPDDGVGASKVAAPLADRQWF